MSKTWFLIYIGHLNSSINTVNSDQPRWKRLEVHLRLYALADRFNLPQLMTLASRRFRTSCAWSPVPTTNNRMFISSVFLQTMFIDLIKFAAISLPVRADKDPSNLRHWLVMFTAWLWETLVNNQRLIEVLDAHPDFAKEVLYSGSLSNSLKSPWEVESATASSA